MHLQINAKLLFWKLFSRVCFLSKSDLYKERSGYIIFFSILEVLEGMLQVVAPEPLIWTILPEKYTNAIMQQNWIGSKWGLLSHEKK